MVIHQIEGETEEPTIITWKLSHVGSAMYVIGNDGEGEKNVFVVYGNGKGGRPTHAGLKGLVTDSEGRIALDE